MKFFGVVLLLFVVCYSACGKPFPSSKAAVVVTTSTTPKPWLRFLKDKKSTTTTSPIIKMPTNKKDKVEIAENITSPSIVHPASVIRAVGPAPISQTAVDEFWNNLLAYFDPSKFAYQNPPSDPTLAQDRKTNPDSMYDEFYLDWMKRSARAAEPEPQVTATPVEEHQALGASMEPVYQPYMYPTMAYSPYFPLAGLKMQKVMAQAQLDAALTAMNITTTPKPIKLKLKITLPGGSDLTQLSAITNSLPPGSTYVLS